MIELNLQHPTEARVAHFPLKRALGDLACETLLAEIAMLAGAAVSWMQQPQTLHAVERLADADRILYSRLAVGFASLIAGMQQAVTAGRLWMTSDAEADAVEVQVDNGARLDPVRCPPSGVPPHLAQFARFVEDGERLRQRVGATCRRIAWAMHAGESSAAAARG